MSCGVSDVGRLECIFLLLSSPGRYRREAGRGEKGSECHVMWGGSN